MCVSSGVRSVTAIYWWTSLNVGARCKLQAAMQFDPSEVMDVDRLGGGRRTVLSALALSRWNSCVVQGRWCEVAPRKRAISLATYGNTKTNLTRAYACDADPYPVNLRPCQMSDVPAVFFRTLRMPTAVLTCGDTVGCVCIRDGEQNK